VKRVQIVGSIGSGKTSLGKKLSKKLNIPHLELDTLFWLPGWEIRPALEIIDLAYKEAEKPTWIFCGNYSFLKHVTLDNADTIVWLDYPFWLCFWQTLKRAIKNIIKQQKCCNGNQETFTRLFFSKNSILLWMIRTFKRRNERYAQLMHDPEYTDKTFVRFKSRKETKQWLENLHV